MRRFQAFILSACLLGVSVGAVLVLAPPVAHADDELEQGFAKIKKGKARRFVLTHKGSKVHLVLFTKGSFEKRVKLAKKELKGEAAWGTCSVDATKKKKKGTTYLAFKVARDEGFEQAPLSSTTLEKALSKELGEKVKVRFEIVDEADDLDEIEED